ncbi:hypothetical protein KY308_03970 [Candidatus Woesearchaeota archaeon]|nr:hypothetical protein [Candidatus Woesearchaeota archaeon]
MFRLIQKNFLFLWVLVLLTIAIVLSLTFSGCSSSEAPEVSEQPQVVAESQPETPATGKATSVLCSDSDGQDKLTKGRVTVGNISYVDKCASPFLIEYYCEDGAVANKIFRCECEGGACK